MNYRHAFHAGNFADVVKHAVLARIVAHLKEKPAAFRVIDTHAGAGVYDISGPEAARTGEWREGIGKLAAAKLAPAVRALLAPYLDAVAMFTRGGSPQMANRHLCALVPHQGHARERKLCAPPRAARPPTHATRGADPAGQGGRAPAWQRPHPHQPALEAGKRAWRSSACAGRRA